MSSNIVRFSPIITVAFGDIPAAYANLGPAFAHAMRVLHFINDTDKDMMISFDGITDNIVVLANTFSLYDLTAQEDINEMFRYEKGSQLRFKYLEEPTSGSFYVISVYGKGE